MPMNQKNNVCEICGRYGRTDIHHVFEGNGRRKISDEWGATIEVCADCHRKIHARPKAYIWLKQKCQREVMARYGLNTEEFIERIGKSYL